MTDLTFSLYVEISNNISMAEVVIEMNFLCTSLHNHAQEINFKSLNIRPIR